jgi:mannitol/fructose-specific phosphotransferase system IIA component (Ntr-type)
VRLADLLSADRIKIPLLARTKEEALRELVALVAKSPEAEGALLASVLERERKMSTGIGRGVAIPHGRSAEVHGLQMAFGVAGEPIDYGSLDGKPVRLLFLLVSTPDQPSAHCEALGRIARVLASDTAAGDLLDAGSPAEVLSVLGHEEDGLGE